MAKKTSSSDKKDEKNKDNNNEVVEKKKDKSDSSNVKTKVTEGFVSLKKYVKDSFNELKKVQWPTRKQALGETVVVIITVIFFTSLTILFDRVLGWFFGIIFGV